MSEIKPIDDIRANLGKMAAQFKAVMPTQEHVERFIRITVTAVQQNAKLLDADRNSFYAACMKAAQDGLLPDGKEAVLTVYNTNVGSKDKPDWKSICQYQPMVEGMMKKLRLSGEIVGAPRVHVVKANDAFEYQLGDEEVIVHKPALSERGETIGAYSIIVFTDGARSREYMSRSEIDAIRARSKTPDYGPWKTDFDEMARKTVFRRHSKRLPKSTDLDNVLASDDDTFVPFADRQPASAAPEPVPALPPPDVRPGPLQKVVDAASGGEKVVVDAGTPKPPADVL